MKRHKLKPPTTDRHRSAAHSAAAAYVICSMKPNFNSGSTRRLALIRLPMTVSLDFSAVVWYRPIPQEMGGVDLLGPPVPSPSADDGDEQDTDLKGGRIVRSRTPDKFGTRRDCAWYPTSCRRPRWSIEHGTNPVFTCGTSAPSAECSPHCSCRREGGRGTAMRGMSKAEI